MIKKGQYVILHYGFYSDIRVAALGKATCDIGEIQLEIAYLKAYKLIKEGVEDEMAIRTSFTDFVVFFPCISVSHNCYGCEDEPVDVYPVAISYAAGEN